MIGGEEVHSVVQLSGPQALSWKWPKLPAQQDPCRRPTCVHGRVLLLLLARKQNPIAKRFPEHLTQINTQINTSLLQLAAPIDAPRCKTRRHLELAAHPDPAPP